MNAFLNIFHSICKFFKIPISVDVMCTYLLTYSMEQSPSGEANWFCS